MTKENNKVDINKHEMDIGTLKKQNVNDLLSIKELYKRIEELGEKITQVKYIDNTLVKKIKKEYEKLKKIILDENIQVQLDNKIDEFNIKLTNDIETINSQLTNDIETINSEMVTKASKVDLKEQASRIDNIVAVQDSTDNLETADIRIGLDGEKYGSAGEAVREQNKRIYEEIVNKITPINLLYNPVKIINDGDMVRYANDGQPNAIHIDAGSLILHFYKIQPSTEYYFNTIGTGLSKIAFFESLDTTSGICYFTKFVSNWNTKITSPENANYIVVSYNPSLKDTMYFGTESDFLLFSKYKKNQVLKDNILVKDLNERIELLERKKHVTIGLNGDFKTIKDGFKYAFENDLTAIIEPGVYDLVSEGISGIGYIAPKEVYGYGVTLLCNLEEENWLLSPINISPNSKGSKIYGLTIICSNCRYCIHDDMGGQLIETHIPFYHNVYKDLLLIHNSVITSVLKAPQCIGGGFGDYGYIEIDNCVFDSKIYADVSYHSKSWNPQTPQTNDCVLICKDSVFKSTFSISAIGNDTSYMNKVYISNCLMKSLPDVRDRTNIKFISWNNVKSTK